MKILYSVGDTKPALKFCAPKLLLICCQNVDVDFVKPISCNLLPAILKKVMQKVFHNLIFAILFNYIEIIPFWKMKNDS